MQFILKNGEKPVWNLKNWESKKKKRKKKDTLLGASRI